MWMSTRAFNAIVQRKHLECVMPQVTYEIALVLCELHDSLQSIDEWKKINTDINDLTLSSLQKRCVAALASAVTGRLFWMIQTYKRSWDLVSFCFWYICCANHWKNRRRKSSPRHRRGQWIMIVIADKHSLWRSTINLCIPSTKFTLPPPY
jgi:hypothetical protein